MEKDYKKRSAGNRPRKTILRFTFTNTYDSVKIKTK